MFPAFKEWRVIVEALGAGEQMLILRKGGIAEGRGGFQLTASRFWLFPTDFHAQREKTKPAAARWFSTAEVLPPATGRAATAADELATETELAKTTDKVELRYFADVAHHAFLTDWAAVARLDRHHLWTEETVRDRFEWSKPPGIHAFVVRVHRLDTPLSLSLTPAIAGCKSWIETEFPFDAQPSSPVLGEAMFRHRLSEIGLDHQ